MDARNLVVLIQGEAAGLGSRIARAMLGLGAQRVILVAGAVECGREDNDLPDRLIYIPDDELDGHAELQERLAQLERVDVVINLISLATRCGADQAHDIAAINDAMIRSATRFAATMQVLLQNGASRGAIVNVGWLPDDLDENAIFVSMLSGSLRVLTQDQARRLAPQIRVNAVVSLYAGSDMPDDEDIGPVMFLASSAARHITGSVLTADSGRRLGFSAFSKSTDNTG